MIGSTTLGPIGHSGVDRAVRLKKGDKKMAKLTTKARKKLPKKDFAVPPDGYPTRS